jgi:hypothetical protein
VTFGTDEDFNQFVNVNESIGEEHFYSDSPKEGYPNDEETGSDAFQVFLTLRNILVIERK